MSTYGKINATMKLRILKELRYYISAFDDINNCIGGQNSPGMDLFLFMLKPIEMKFIDWYEPSNSHNNYKQNTDKLITTGIYNEIYEEKAEARIVNEIGKRIMTLRLFHGTYTQAERRYHENKIRRDSAGIFSYMFYAYKWKLICNDWNDKNPGNLNKWFYTYGYMYRQFVDSSTESTAGKSDPSQRYAVSEIHNRVFLVYKSILNGNSTLANQLYDNTIRLHVNRITERLFFLTSIAQIKNFDVNEAHRILIKYESELSVTGLFCLDSILYKYLEFKKKWYESANQTHEMSRVDDTESDSDSNDSHHTKDQLDVRNASQSNRSEDTESDDDSDVKTDQIASTDVRNASQSNRYEDTESDDDSDVKTEQIASTAKSHKGKPKDKRKKSEHPKHIEKKYQSRIFHEEGGSMPFKFAKKLTM